MEKGQTGNAFEKFHHPRTGSEPILPCLPGLQRGAGDIKPVGGLTLGEPVGLQSAILLEQCSAMDAIPSLVPISIATLANSSPNFP